MATDTKTRNVGILIFDGVELLDFCGPYEAFTAAGRYEGQALFNTFTVAEKAGPVRAFAGTQFLPDHTFEDCPPIDILVVPGGQGTRREIDNPAMIDWIRSAAGGAELTTSVCTGSFLIARAGALHDGSRATTHWGSVERMRERFPGIEVLEGVRFVDDGAVVSSAGVSAGIDMSLHVIERLCGPAAAESSARLMEYDYWKPAESRSGDRLDG
jgi:transcriptional regulator GlxA family with amidase domain